MAEKDQTKQDLMKWKGRCLELCETACQLCRACDPDLCRHCRVEKIRREAEQRDSSMQGL